MVNQIQTSLCFSWYDNKIWYTQILTFCFYFHFSKNSNILGIWVVCKSSIFLDVIILSMFVKLITPDQLCSRMRKWAWHLQTIYALLNISKTSLHWCSFLVWGSCHVLVAVLPKAYTKWWVLTSSFCIFNLIKVSLSNTFSTLKIIMLKNVTFFSHEQHSNTENILILIVHYDCFTCLSNFYKLFTASHAV